MTHRENTISTRVYFFMFHLSIADEMTAFFTLLPEIVWSLTKEFHGGNIVCKSVKFLQMLGPYLRYEKKITLRYKRFSLVSILDDVITYFVKWF